MERGYGKNGSTNRTYITAKMIYVLYPIDEKATGVIITTVFSQRTVPFHKLIDFEQTHEIESPVC